MAVYKFERYALDLRAGSLRRDGVRIPVQDLPLRLLAILAEHAGEVVGRDELQRRLWPDKSFADFEDGLNTAMRKLRQALEDDPRQPKWIETVRGYGYRLLATVEVESNGATNGHAAAESAPSLLAPVVAPSPESSAPRRHRAAVIAFAVAAAGLLATLWWFTPEPPPTVARVTAITTSGKLDYCIRPATDGSRLFYLERDGDRWRLMQTSTVGGEPQAVSTPFKSAAIFDVSPDGGQMLAGSFEKRNGPMELWTLPVQGGPPVRLGDLKVRAAAWSHDGQTIAFTADGGLWLAHADGASARKIASVPGDLDWPGWSPDDTHLRFTQINWDTEVGRIWDVRADGANLHPLLAGWSTPPSESYGSWSPDGQYYVFNSRHSGTTDVWAIREKGTSWFPWRRSPSGPFRLTQGPLNVIGATFGADNRHIYYCGERFANQMESFGPDGRSHERFLPSVNPQMVSFSRDGGWMVYTSPHFDRIWRSRADGTDAQRLLVEPNHIWFPRWSPDGKFIAFAGKTAGAPMMAYVVARDGGVPELIVPQWTDVRDPDWSPDGKTLVVSHAGKLALVDLATHTPTEIDGSNDLWGPRWSPSGRYIAATLDGQEHVRIFDTETRTWHSVGDGKAIGIGVWGADDTLFFQDLLGPGEALYRVRPNGGPVTRVAEFSGMIRGPVSRCALITVAPDGRILMSMTESASDLYAIELGPAR